MCGAETRVRLRKVGLQVNGLAAIGQRLLIHLHVCVRCCAIRVVYRVRGPQLYRFCFAWGLRRGQSVRVVSQIVNGVGGPQLKLLFFVFEKIGFGRLVGGDSMISR